MNTTPGQSEATADPVKIKLDHYGSDSPGYCGPIELALKDNKLVYSREEYEGHRPKKGTVLPWYHQEGTLPVTLPKLVKVDDFNAEMHRNLLLDNFSFQDRLSYLDEDGKMEVEAARIKVLAFEDGSQGFFMVHCESCYFTLVAIGHIRVEVEAYGDPDDELIFTQF